MKEASSKKVLPAAESIESKRFAYLTVLKLAFLFHPPVLLLDLSLLSFASSISSLLFPIILTTPRKAKNSLSKLNNVCHSGIRF